MKMVSFHQRKMKKDFALSFVHQNQESHLFHYSQKVKNLNYFLNRKDYLVDKHHCKQHKGYKRAAWRMG